MSQITAHNATVSPVSPLPAGRMDDPQARLAYVLAGNATFTVVNRETSKRFTFRVKKRKKSPHTVLVLSGPHDYQFVGTVFVDNNYRFAPARSAPPLESALALPAWQWLWRRLSKLQPIEPAELYHMGRCGRCGRILTVPESINSGIGPECQRRMK